MIRSATSASRTSTAAKIWLTATVMTVAPVAGIMWAMPTHDSPRLRPRWLRKRRTSGTTPRRDWLPVAAALAGTLVGSIGTFAITVHQERASHREAMRTERFTQYAAVSTAATKLIDDLGVLEGWAAWLGRPRQQWPKQFKDWHYLDRAAAKVSRDVDTLRAASASAALVASHNVASALSRLSNDLFLTATHFISSVQDRATTAQSTIKLFRDARVVDVPFDILPAEILSDISGFADSAREDVGR